MNDDIVYDFVRRLGIGGPPTHTLPEDWIPTPDNDHACPWIREEADFTVCTDRYPPMPEGLTDREHRAQLTEDSDYRCRACDLSMGLGSRSLTMEELMRAYSTFATGGTMIEPYYIEEVRDRDGNVLESHADVAHVQVLDPAVAYITTWLMEGVVQGGTAGRAARLGLHLAGKTGTTNDEKDMWFIGFNPEVITSVYVGYDQPRSLGVSSTGGRTALPIWMEYMAVAVPPERDYAFPVTGDVEWANIEESTGRRVTGGGRRFPFLRGTVPESTGISAGQVSIDDIQTEL
jgi:membrane carboxypeptidase/penicillin-binding protein